MHKIGLKVLLGWVLFLPITAYSLGLGDIDVRSFLNQPLRAEISIISARPGEIDDLLVGLANREAFARASLSRPSHLNNLKFKVVKSEDGSTAIITVKTQTAVKEPVLNFLVEADWAKGKVFREFTLLLDPPYFAQQFSKSVAQAKSTLVKSNNVAEPTSRVKESQPEAIVNQGSDVTETASNAGYVNESAIEDEYKYDVLTSETEPRFVEETEAVTEKSAINITDGTTLWSVAKTLKSNGVSMSQVMLALQRLNQDAFGRNNINSLKQGSVLRVPSAQEMSDLSQREAYVEVLNQNGLWNDYLASVGQVSVNASNTQSINQAENNDSLVEEKDNSLAIVTAGEGDSDNAALRSDDNISQISNLKKQLLLSEEEMESVRVERDELSSRVKMLEAELEKRNELENLVNLEDNSLATMEQELTKANDVLSQAEEIQPEMNEDAPKMAQESDEEPILVDDAAMQENPIEMTPEIDAEQMVNDSVENAPVVTEPEIMTQESSQSQVPAPIIVSDPATSASTMIDDVIQAVLTNPLVQGGIAVIALLLLLAVKFFKGRQSQTAKEKSESIEDSLSNALIDTQSGIIIPDVDDEDETPINVPEIEESESAEDFTATLADASPIDDEDEFSKTAVISADDLAVIENDTATLSSDEEQDETLDEVDVYLAYSLFENAEDLLKEKLSEFPDRADYRAKLLETYFATQNVENFSNEASSLKDLGASAEKYWPKVQTMGFELDPSNTMFADGEGGDLSDLAIAKPEMADFDIGATEEESSESEFDISLDSDDENLDFSKELENNEVEVDLDLEFDLEEEIELDINTSDNNSGLSDDLGGLDFHLDDTNDVQKEAEESEFIEIDDGLEFDLEEADLDFSINDDDSIEDSDEELDISLDDIEPELDVGNELIEEDSIEDSLSFETENIDDENIELNIDDVDEDLVELEINDDSLALDETVVKASFEGAEKTVVIPSIEEADETAVMSSFEPEETSVISTLDDQIEKTVTVSALEDEDDDDLLIPNVNIVLDDFDDDDDEDITDIGNIEGLMLPDDVDEVATKLDLAKAFHDMGDSEGARSSLEEVIQDGNDEQKAEAQTLLNEISD